MKTPLLILALLTTLWLLARLGGATPSRRRLAGTLGITLVFGFTGLGHFVKTAPMAAMLPAWVPGPVGWVYATGVIELAAAGAILVRRFRRLTAWGLIALLLLCLPVNAYAALHRIDFGGHAWGPAYLLIRAPLQFILMAWVGYFGVGATRGRTSKPDGDLTSN